MRLLSIQTGKVRSLMMAGGRESTSAIVKTPVTGAVRVGPEGIEGDEQANRRVHGGPDKAINVYCQEHYDRWAEELGRPFAAGAAGENFTLAGALEGAVCIGDIYALGDLRLEVSQPREPCGKLTAHWDVPDLIARIHENGRSGWYLRVLEAGEIAAPGELRLLERPYPAWTIARANRILHFQEGGAETAHALAACPALSESWREVLRKR